MSNTKNNNSNIMIFDLRDTGHHAGYINNLVKYWGTNSFNGSLTIVTSPNFIKKHPDVFETCFKNRNKRIILEPVKEHEYSELTYNKIRNVKFLHNDFYSIITFQEWKLFTIYAKKCAVNFAILMDFDFFQIPIFLGFKPFCPFGAIYFRPRLHYKALFNHKSTRIESIKNLVKKCILTVALKNPWLKTLYCLDNYACEYMKNHIPTKTNVVYLPDPVTIHNDIKSGNSSLRRKLKIDNHRKTFLLFGEIARRKGVYQVLKAVSLLPDSVCSKICLLIAGPVSSHDLAAITNSITQIHLTSSIQIVLDNQFIPDKAIQPYFAISYAVLIPYLKHIGMSAVLTRSVAAYKPVLASNYGLLGKLVQDNNFGLVVNAESTKEIAEGIYRLIDKNVYKYSFNQEKADAFVRKNSSEEYGKTLFSNIGNGF